MEMRRDVFQAIADPTRRDIISLVSLQSMNLNAIAGKFEMSRPAVSKHIKILTECGLIMIRQQGRERYCKAQLDKLTEVADWVEQYRRFWTQKLDALEVYLQEIQANDLKTGNKAATEKKSTIKNLKHGTTNKKK